MNLQKAVFFDRDGVLNVDTGYLYRSEDFQWMPGAKEAIKCLNDQGCLVIVITNQSGVARGYYSEENVQALHHWMNQELAKIGAHIDAFYYCPHYPEGSIDQYRTVCDCRKPEPGLILKAIQEWKIDKTASFLIGDKPSDVEAANKAGIRGILYTGDNLEEYIKGNCVGQDY